MQLHLNAGFGDPLDRATLDWIAGQGFVGVRQDVTADTADARVQDFVGHPLALHALVGGGQMVWPGTRTPMHAGEIQTAAFEVARAIVRHGLVETAAIEVGNEPESAIEHYQHHPETFAEAVRVSAHSVWDVDARIQVMSGGIGNTHTGGLDYLRRVMDAGLPEGVIIGYHCYHTTTPYDVPHDGFSSRDHELDELRRIVGDERRLWHTEGGWHTAPSQVRYGRLKLRTRTVQFTDQQVRDFMAQELPLHASHGAEVYSVFQLNDGQGDHYEDRFGIRYLDGAPKPQCEVYRAWGA